MSKIARNKGELELTLIFTSFGVSFFTSDNSLSPNPTETIGYGGLIGKLSGEGRREKGKGRGGERREREGRRGEGESILRGVIFISI